MKPVKYNSALIIGMGLIGSSICRALKKNNLASNVYGLDNSKDVIKKCRNLNLVSDIQEVCRSDFMELLKEFMKRFESVK